MGILSRKASTIQIRVHEPGMFTLLQDEGRKGYQAWGMPVSGVMDQRHARWANWLAGNPPGAPLLEMTYNGCSLEFSGKALIALCGAEMPLEINGKEVSAHRAHKVRKKDVVRCKAAERGSRAYLAVSGLPATDPVMGSYATYVRGSLGGFQGRPLQQGDILYWNSTPASATRKLPEGAVELPSPRTTLRFVEGIDYASFDPISLMGFLSEQYTVASESDRMGLRLQGKPVKHISSPDVLSYPIPFGTLQVPGNGIPILMLADRQTTGGYTQLGYVIRADHHLMAQLRSGDQVQFALVSFTTAEEAYAESMKQNVTIRKHS